MPINDFTGKETMRKALSGPELAKHAINAQSLRNAISGRQPFITLFFLDCCRTYHLRNAELQKNMQDPQVRLRHGSRAMPPSAGSLIAFACAPGTTADDDNGSQRNGLFTKHLLKHITTPNENVQQILAYVTRGVIEESSSKQIPHVSSVLSYKNVYLYTGKSDHFDQANEIARVVHLLGSILIEGQSVDEGESTN